MALFKLFRVMNEIGDLFGTIFCQEWGGFVETILCQEWVLGGFVQIIICQDWDLVMVWFRTILCTKNES